MHSSCGRLWKTIEQKRDAYADLSQRHIQQMVRLIDDLTDVSRITHGKIHLARERVDLVTVASERRRNPGAIHQVVRA